MKLKTSRTVLVVDDEPKILSSIEDLLEEDFEVVTAASAEEALRHVEEREFATILSDQRMPGMSGAEFFSRVQERSHATRLLITGYSDLGALVDAVNHGQIYAYVSKPWEPLELRLLVLKAVEHYETVRALSHETELLHCLMDNIPDGIYFKNSERRYTRVNRALASLLGAPDPGQVVNCRAADFLPPAEAAAVESEEAEVLASGVPVLDAVNELATPGEGKRWLSSTKVPIRDPEGDVVGLVGITRDVTERHMADEELAQVRETLKEKEVKAALAEELQRLAEELRRSNEELEQFASIASHDLREPLRGIRLITSLMRQDYAGRLDQGFDDHLSRLQARAARMEDLIRDLLALARVGRAEKAFARVPADDALTMAVANLSDCGQAELTRDPLPEVVGDESQLVQLFQNLVGNALKYQEPDTRPHIHVSASRDGGEWIFSVQDDGIGIETEYLNRIFEPFKRLHSREEYSGSGIGLAICAKIVERHGGRIWAESDGRGKGATFRFALPEREP